MQPNLKSERGAENQPEQELKNGKFLLEQLCECVHTSSCFPVPAQSRDIPFRAMPAAFRGNIASFWWWIRYPLFCPDVQQRITFTQDLSLNWMAGQPGKGRASCLLSDSLDKTETLTLWDSRGKRRCSKWGIRHAVIFLLHLLNSWQEPCLWLQSLNNWGEERKEKAGTGLMFCDRWLWGKHLCNDAFRRVLPTPLLKLNYIYCLWHF